MGGTPPDACCKHRALENVESPLGDCRSHRRWAGCKIHLRVSLGMTPYILGKMHPGGRSVMGLGCPLPSLLVNSCLPLPPHWPWGPASGREVGEGAIYSNFPAFSEGLLRRKSWEGGPWCQGLSCWLFSLGCLGPWLARWQEKWPLPC